MRNTTKRIIALVLVAFMVAACMAVGVSAAEPKVTVNVLTGSVEVSADALAKLADGNRAADATAFSDANLVGFKNTGFTHTDGVDAAVEATVEIVADLGEEKVVSGVYLDCFKDSNSMIAVPSVLFYVSADGVDYYCLNNEARPSSKDDAEELKVVTLANDSTRAAVKARYIKAVATFKNGWIFVSEIGIIEPTAEQAAEAQTLVGTYPVLDSTLAEKSIGLFNAADGEMNLAENGMKNCQIIIGKYDEAAKAYKMTRNTVNPWPDGNSGTVTLADDELLLAISTGGNLADGVMFSTAKWIARGLGEGWFTLSDATVDFYPASHTFADAHVEESSEEPSEEPSKEEPKPVEDNKNILAGAQYTVEGTTRTGGYGDTNDDGTCKYRLTDGTWADGTVDYCAGYDSAAKITFDLGEVKKLSGIKFDAYAGAWGIALPTSAEVLISDDGETFTSLKAFNVEDCVASTGDWTIYNFEVTDVFSARYIRIDYEGSHTWISEVEAYAAKAEAPADESKGSTEPTSDSGIVALAVVASLAVAGAVVIKKSR